MSKVVELTALADEVARWGPGFLLSVSDGERPHLLALEPQVIEDGDGVMLRFAVGGGRVLRNASARPAVTVLFPPQPDGDGFSLVVDGMASVDGETVDVRATSAVLHRPAPPLESVAP